MDLSPKKREEGARRRAAAASSLSETPWQVDRCAFDEELFMGYEESDVWNRIDMLSESWHGRFFRHKRFVHLGGSSQRIRTPELFALLHVEHATVHHFYDKYGLDFRRFLRYEREQAQLRVWYWRLRREQNLCREAQLHVVELDRILKLEK